MKKFKPVIQIETWGEHKPIVESAFSNAGFEKYYLHGTALKKAIPGEQDPAGDLIFIHKDKTL